MHEIIDFFLHLDVHLTNIVNEYQTMTYLILCLIIFVETGLVVMPFLPGDSLLFAAGSIAAMNGSPLNIWLLIPLLFLSAILGDNTNYLIGSRLGTKVFDWKIKFLKREYLDRTQRYFDKHGGQTLIMARFIPIVRTFAPFAAGVGTMKYSKFIGFCIAGGILWVCLLTLAGYFFGSIPIVKNNFEIVILAIVGTSVIPMIYQFFKQKMQPKA